MPENPFEVTIQFSTRFDEYEEVTLRIESAPFTVRAASCATFATLRPSSAVMPKYFGSSSCRFAPDCPLYSAGSGSARNGSGAMARATATESEMNVFSASGRRSLVPTLE